MIESSYKRINNITGWLVWLFATIVYVMTIEPTASFWDCGEFIASGFKQQVGHPPGAPLWLMIARIFSLFAGDNLENVAAMVNTFSALCSSFSILFLFWTITGLAKKLAGPLTAAKQIAIMGSGLIGAAAYTFTDSFWFSAVEGEVYAASSFTTALVFWLLIKWEAESTKPYADRLLILVAYVMGLSIGIHILNLLAIPALVYIYYFKRFKTSGKGLIYAGLASVVILGVVQAGIISAMVKLATKFEIFFTNDIGLPYNTGMWMYFVLVAGLLGFGIYYSSKKKLPNLQNAVYSVLVILIGYSSFAMIVIRSGANPPMDENNPENIVNLLPYLNREQYGDRPLLHGQSFTSELDAKEPYLDAAPVYYKPENAKEDRYLVADERKGHTPNYDEKSCMVFPRMYSTQAHHIRAYRQWSDFKGKKVKVKVRTRSGDYRNKSIRIPTFGENMQFFFNYQINFMYWRYFMWNFVGRQNDKQGHGLGKDALLQGNWLSGVDFIDSAHLGDQKSLPDSLKNNPGRNSFFFLPLILGIIGMIYHFSKNWKDASVVMMLFFMTGLAIVVYLNQYPYQPRERDYAYAGSFYAFAIWIGLGVQALFALMNKSEDQNDEGVEEKKHSGFEGKLRSLGVYDYTLALVSLLGFGIVFTYGDNLTVGYSFLFISLVIIAVVAVCLLLRKVISNASVKAVLAIALCLYVPYVMGEQGWDDHDRSDKYTARDFAKNYLKTCEPNAVIFTNGDNDTFPLWYVQDVEGFRTDVRVVNLSLLNTDWYIDQMVRKAYESERIPFSLTQDQYRQGTRDYVYVDKRWKGFQDISKVMDFIKSDAKGTKLRLSNKSWIDYVPADSLSVPVDSAKVLANGTVLPEFKDQIPASMDWKIGGGAVLKAKLMILDLLANNDWERPIYFAITVGDDHYMNLEEFFQLEGLAYRVTPIKHPRQGAGETGWIHVDKMYDNLVNNYEWGNMEKPGVYMGEQVQRMSMNYRNNFARLAKTLARDHKDNERAIKVLDRCMEVMPPEKIPYNFFSIYLADAYFIAGGKEKGVKIMTEILDQYMEELEWYSELDEDKQILVKSEIDRAQQAIQTAGFFASRAGVKEVEDKVQGMLEQCAAMGFSMTRN